MQKQVEVSDNFIKQLVVDTERSGHTQDLINALQWELYLGNVFKHPSNLFLASR